MKKPILGMMMFLFSFQSFSQQVYWQCFNIVVDSPTEFATLLDAFMKTESRKHFNCIINFKRGCKFISLDYNIEGYPCWIDKASKKERFKCIGIALQIGDVSGGHYICLKKIKDKWHKFDDEKVIELEENPF